MRNKRFGIGYRVMCYESGVIGTVIRFYTPTSCEEQTVVQTEDGRQYHAPTRTWILYTDGLSTSNIICDEFAVSSNSLNPYGQYVVNFANNHGVSISESIGRQICKSRLDFFNQTGR